MFRFEDPIYLYLLAVIPVILLIRFLMVRQQKKRLRKFGDRDLLRQLMPDVSRLRPAVKFWLLLGALTLLIVMLARPQMGTKISHEKRTGIETIICMDISNSMLAEDVAPSRLDRSKMMVENLVDHFTNDKIGLIVFAGDAFIQLPITSDYVSAKMFLSNIDPSMIATQGTDIAAAINMASHSFTQQEGVGQAIIVITDGEEKSSREFSSSKVKQLIEREKKEHGWEFLFLGANMDAITAARRFGISENRAVRYECDAKGTALNFSVLSKTIGHFRAGAPIEADWSEEIRKDYESRDK